MAIGSASEVEYLLLLARDLRYVDAAEFGNLEEQVIEVRRMLIGFLRRLQSESVAGQ
jgi:four helix bundle protein